MNFGPKFEAALGHLMQHGNQSHLAAQKEQTDMVAKAVKQAKRKTNPRQDQIDAALAEIRRKHPDTYNSARAKELLASIRKAMRELRDQIHEAENLLPVGTTDRGGDLSKARQLMKVPGVEYSEHHRYGLTHPDYPYATIAQLHYVLIDLPRAIAYRKRVERAADKAK